MNNKIKHLEFIENVINRMAKNSFMLKGWAVTIVVGVIAIVAKQAVLLWLITLLPIFVFWGLDAYYLALEREYRKLYDKVRETKEEDIDFAMKVKVDFKSTLKAFLSVSTAPFYGALIVGTIIIGIIVNTVG